MQHYKDLLVNIIFKHLPHVKIILYGSRARGDWKEGSDIDIALQAEKKIDPLVLATIMADIEESTLPINFDIVDFNAVSEDMRKEILKYGIVWQK